MRWAMGNWWSHKKCGRGVRPGVVSRSVPAQRELAGTSLFARLYRFRGCVAALQN